MSNFLKACIYPAAELDCQDCRQERYDYRVEAVPCDTCHDKAVIQVPAFEVREAMTPQGMLWEFASRDDLDHPSPRYGNADSCFFAAIQHYAYGD